PLLDLAFPDRAQPLPRLAPCPAGRPGGSRRPRPHAGRWRLARPRRRCAPAPRRAARAAARGGHPPLLSRSGGGRGGRAPRLPARDGEEPAAPRAPQAHGDRAPMTPGCDDVLAARFLDEADAAVEAHVATCARCAAERERVESVRALLAAATVP